MKKILNIFKKQKIVAIVKMNGREALVFKYPIKLKYKFSGSHGLIGVDDLGVCYSFLSQKGSSGDAFAGRKFTIKTDKEVIECSGQWWDEANDDIKKELNICAQNRHMRISVSDIESLKECYVFTGYSTLEICHKKIAKLKKAYKGRVYDYWEYEKLIKQNK